MNPSVLYGPLALAANLGAAPADGPLRVIHSGDTVPKNLPKPILCQKHLSVQLPNQTNGSGLNRSPICVLPPPPKTSITS
jgi:hypothetical protein